MRIAWVNRSMMLVAKGNASAAYESTRESAASHNRLSSIGRKTVRPYYA